MSASPFGFIAVPTPVVGRYTSFWQALAALQLPDGMTFQRDVHIGRGCSPAENRNGLIAEAQAADAEWIFFLDDDLVFYPDVLTRLLTRLADPAVEAVVGLSFMRQHPDRSLWLRGGQAITELPPPGPLMKLDGSTLGGLLIRLSAIEKMTRPYVTLGQCDPSHQTWGDDTYFCKKLKDAGVQLWGDSTVRFGHTTDLEIWPHYDEANGWSTVYCRSLEPLVMQPFGTLEPQESR